VTSRFCVALQHAASADGSPDYLGSYRVQFTAITNITHSSLTAAADSAAVPSLLLCSTLHLLMAVLTTLAAVE
jgi:hypothetical protein